MDYKNTTIIASLITLALVMTAAVPYSLCYQHQM